MRSDKERIALLHQRAEELKRQKEKHALTLWGSASAGLAALLLVLTLQFTGAPHGLGQGMFSASSLLGESAGGYVLAAVIAFAAGVVITTLIRRYRSKTKNRNNTEEPKAMLEKENEEDNR